MNCMKVKIKLIPTEEGKTAPLPQYQSEYSAGADLCACTDKPVTIAPHGRALIPSGLAIEMVALFLDTEFEGGRHQRRIDLVSQIEAENAAK